MGEREQLARLWRKYGYGRLYWRNKHPNWRAWDSGDIAMARDGAIRQHFESLQAIRAFLEENIPRAP